MKRAFKMKHSHKKRIEKFKNQKLKFYGTIEQVNMAVSHPHTFSLRSHNYQVLPSVTRGLLPHILKSIHKIYLHSTQLKGVLKNSKEGSGIIQISRKEKHFQSHKKLSAIQGNLILHHPSLSLPKRPSSFLQLGQVVNIHGHLFDKNFLICFSSLSMQAEQKEDDEHFANHPQILVGLLLGPKNLYYVQNIQ